MYSDNLNGFGKAIEAICSQTDTQKFYLKFFFVVGRTIHPLVD